VILKAVRVPEYCLFVSAFGFRALHCSLAEILEVLGNKVIPCSICREELVQPLALRCRLIPKANEALATVSGENFKNDEELYAVLTTEVIPEYEKAIEKAKALEVNVEELKPIKDKIEEALGVYYDALLLEKEALEKTDKELIEQSNEKGSEYLTAISEYHEEMGKLAEEYGIDYQITK